MKAGRIKNTSLNIIFSIVLQLVVFVRGLIVPRIIIPTYGSDINGVFSSISQFLAYISLLEAGIGSIFRASLYKPLAENDMETVSGVINAQKRFYKRIGCIFIVYVAVLCFIYPYIAKTNASRGFVITCILILCVNTLTEYFVSLPYVSLLSADQKIRISYIVSIVYTLVNILVSLFWAAFKADIRLIYLSMCVIGLLRPLFYSIYIKKHYKLDKTIKPNENALSQRWNGMVHHFAFYIHTNTDTAILTILISTAMVSVYNIYGAIVFGVERIISSISTGIAASLGNLLVSNDKKRIDDTVNIYEFVQGSVATILFTITSLMLIPFISLYTAKMTDINYIRPEFGYTLIAAESMYCFRCIYSTISMNANKFKETQLGAILECVINILFSLFFVVVLKLGILGVAIGTLVAMSVRYAFEVWFLSKNVIFRSVFSAMKMLVVSCSVAALSIVICRSIIPYADTDTFIKWIIYAIITGIVTLSVSFAVYYIFFKKTMMMLFDRVIHKNK